ncbi:MAG: division/cell wall cluster transcriptional repressor MraZ [Calditrichia bacterium]
MEEGKLKFHTNFRQLLDAKGRINMPARFREVIEKNGDQDRDFIIVKGSDRNLALFPVREWEVKLEEVLMAVPDGKKRRNLKRLLNLNSSAQRIDKQGRLNIPAEFIEYANLKKEVVLVGSTEKIEIWNPQDLNATVDESQEETLAIQDTLDI